MLNNQVLCGRLIVQIVCMSRDLHGYSHHCIPLAQSMVRVHESPNESLARKRHDQLADVSPG